MVWASSAGNPALGVSAVLSREPAEAGVLDGVTSLEITKPPVLERDLEILVEPVVAPVESTGSLSHGVVRTALV